MSRRFQSLPSSRSFILATAAALLPACATTPAGSSLVVGQQASIEGDVVRVDTDPWAYDGNAVVSVATPAGATVQVQLPARWNLCKAQPPGNVQALEPGDRVRATGTVSAPGELVVCEQAQHQLRKID